MPPEPSKKQEETGLVIQRGAGLVTIPHGESPSLSEIINRSLAHIKASQSLATRQREPGEECEFEIAPGVMMRMCWIPPGAFLMGSPVDEVGRQGDETLHRVTITQGFWLGKYQVTQAQWVAVMGSNPSYFKGANLPVEQISWDDLSRPGGFLEQANRFAAAGESFSFPTEAQWEYACRAGTTTALNNGKNLTLAWGNSPNLDEVGCYGGNSDDKTDPCGLKKANAWGLHDMHGNLCEWCADWYRDYPVVPMNDPRGPNSGSARVLRGGSWCVCPGDCRAANRDCEKPAHSDPALGFRPARSSIP